jgi:competence protein ComEA
VAAAIVGVALLLTRGSRPAAPVVLPRAKAGTTVPPEHASGTGGSRPDAGAVTAHAAGAVLRPGVYVLPAEARVADLLAAAGGPSPEADVDQLNLATKVADGDRVYLPRRGEQPVPNVAPGGPGGAAGPSSTRPTVVDLNVADATQLESLPGIGPTLAAAIVEHRTRNGRFRSVDDLLEVPGIGPARLATLRPLVRV